MCIVKLLLIDWPKKFTFPCITYYYSVWVGCSGVEVFKMWSGNFKTLLPRNLNYLIWRHLNTHITFTYNHGLNIHILMLTIKLFSKKRSSHGPLTTYIMVIITISYKCTLGNLQIILSFIVGILNIKKINY